MEALVYEDDGSGGRGALPPDIASRMAKAMPADIASRIAYSFNGDGQYYEPPPLPGTPMPAPEPTHIQWQEVAVLAEEVGPVVEVAGMPVAPEPAPAPAPAPAEIVCFAPDGLPLHMSARNATGYKNVFASGNEFVVNHWQNGRTQHLGYYPTALEAAIAYAQHLNHIASVQQAEAAGQPPPPPLPPQKKAPKNPLPDLVTEYDGVQLWLSDRSSTGYKCVYKNGTGYSVDIGAGDGRMQHVGSYRTALEGAVAYARYMMDSETLPTQSPEAIASWQLAWTPEVIASHTESIKRMKYSGALGDMATCAAEYTVDTAGVQYEQQQYDQYYPEQYYAASSLTHVVDGSYVDEADPDAEELEQRRLGA